MRFAAVQFDIVWEDKAANHAIIERMLHDADPALAPGTFVLLPELGDTGFSMNLDRIVDDRSLQWGLALARRNRIWLQIGYAERGTDGRGRNCAAVLDPQGTIAGLYRKVHPFSYGREAQFYGGGDRAVIVACDGAGVAPMICYDLRFPELWRLAALAGAEVFTIGASWPAARRHHWRTLAIARAIENQAFVVAVNRVGRDPHLQYGGGSIIVSPTGEILAEAADEPCVLHAELDLVALRRWRQEFPALRDAHRDLLGTIKVEHTPIPEPRAGPTPASAKRR
jgi:predicted amidohydrolase